MAYSKPSLRQYLMKKNNNTITTCTLANCTIRDPNICQKPYTIYHSIFLKCHNFYIGSTFRPLYIRIKGYLNKYASSLHKHLINTKIMMIIFLLKNLPYVIHFILFSVLSLCLWMLYSFRRSHVSWGCIIHQLHLCRGLRPLHRMTWI